VILPTTGQSYNPSVEGYEELIQQVVEHAEPRRGEPFEKVVRSVRRVVPKAKNKKQREQQLKALQRLEEKERLKEVEQLPHFLA
jgi:hypothetical protein